MMHEKLSSVFTGFGVKRLTPHQVDPEVSHGHELQGASSLRELLGEGNDRRRMACSYFWLPRDEEGEVLRVDSTATWYNARAGQPHRSPEWRLYYSADADPILQGKASAGDLAVVGVGRDSRLYILIAAAGSTWERRLQVLFGLPVGTGTGGLFDVESVNDEREIGLAEHLLLDALGFETRPSADRRAEAVAAELFNRFNGQLPSTVEFSKQARRHYEGPSAEEDPDAALVGWMEWETLLFKLFEARLVAQRIAEGFHDREGRPDVEAFVRFARSVGNTRFSRAGWAFEHHVAALLDAHGVRYTARPVTEQNKRPDLIFPGISHYRDAGFPSRDLRMLALKTSLKDRWRQVANEADRIRPKHLLTLEAPVSRAQMEEMEAVSVRLVVPASHLRLFDQPTCFELMSVRDFIQMVLEIQRRHETYQCRG